MLRILCPFNTADEVAKLATAGADELYCGVLSQEWAERFTSVASSNKREDASANLKDFGELGRAADVAHSAGARVNVTFNALYTQEQYPLLLDEMRLAVEAGADALIVADIGLLLFARESGLDVSLHMSTIGAAFNSEAIRFYGDLGASRVILPRQLSIDEIAELAAGAGDMELEVFAKNEACRNVDGFCTFLHVSKALNEQLGRSLHAAVGRGSAAGARSAGRGQLEPAMFDRPCGVRCRVEPVAGSAEVPEAVIKNVTMSVNDTSCADPCGACRLGELDRMGVHGIKIVGRHRSTVAKCKDVVFLKTTRDMIGAHGDDEPTRVAAIKAAYEAAYGFPCGEACYYVD